MTKAQITKKIVDLEYSDSIYTTARLYRQLDMCGLTKKELLEILYSHPRYISQLRDEKLKKLGL